MMKKGRILNTMTLLALFAVLFIGSAWGYDDGDQQARKGRAGHGELKQRNGLNLTDVQKEEMKALKISFMKEMTPVKNQLGIKMAELKAASVGDNVNTKAVNKLIDEIATIKANMAKKHFANKQKVRSMLDDDQKVMFDANAGKGHKGARHGKGMQQGRDGRQGKFHKGMKGERGQGQRLGNAEPCESVENNG